LVRVEILINSSACKAVFIRNSNTSSLGLSAATNLI
jgi:hypothetical protein